MSNLYIDIETYSGAELTQTGVYAYAEHPDFEILMAAWSTDSKKVNLAVGAEEVNQIPGLWDSKVTKIAHNAQFERVCFGQPPGSWLCTQALAAEWGYPQKLEKLAQALGGEQKDSAGTALINWFCKPDSKTGKRRDPADWPEKWEQFKAYCIQDVVTLIDVAQRMPGWPVPFEREVYDVDQIINDRGIRVDLPMARRAVEVDARIRASAGQEMCEILGINNAGSVVQIQKALNEQGLKVSNLRAETVQRLIEDENTSPEHRRALELRQLTALVASKKYQAILDAASADSRFRGGFKFGGAHTLRWSSRGVQIQNLASIKLTENQVAARMVDFWMSEPTPEELKALVRSLFFIDGCVVDYAQIEPRVLAWIVGEQWVLNAFKDGRDIYTETAERMGGISRQKGKVAVLALGYAGGVNSLRNMGGDDLGTTDELLSMRDRYRKANPKIVRSWKAIEEAFRSGGTVGRLKIKKVGNDRHLVLPSGRAIVYRNVKWERYRVEIEGVWVEKEGWRFDSALGHRADTYGGRLIENATQAISRDILAHALVNLEQAGYRTVGHVHDEVMVESGDIEGVAKIMCELPGWAKGLPIAAEGFECVRYRKS